jgi:Zn-dependent M28 family amino/carboxypeptidase
MFALCCAALVLVACESQESEPPVERPAFDGAAAVSYARAQMDFGPRVPGSEAHRLAGDWIVDQMKQRADTVIVQTWNHTTASGTTLPLRNVFARFNAPATQRILYVTHWDSRPVAEKSNSPEERASPTPGANDGAAGVGLFVAIGDALRSTPLSGDVGVDLLFVDGEDYGDFGPPLVDVLLGSTYFAAQMPADYTPLFGVVWDMIADKDLRIPYEEISLNRAPEVVELVWRTAQDLGYASTFVRQSQGSITDDHVPLLDKGLRVIDVIDIDYRWHHTTEDTMDKISAPSLQIVGEVAMALLRSR